MIHYGDEIQKHTQKPVSYTRLYALIKDKDCTFFEKQYYILLIVTGLQPLCSQLIILQIGA